MNKVVIWDLDDTLLTAAPHRLIFFQERPKNYRAADAACHLDDIKPQMFKLYQFFKADDWKNVIVTAREGNELARFNTDLCLSRHGFIYDDMFMRKIDDNRPDFEAKYDILYEEVIPKYGLPSIAFEDRPCVADMWRKQGIFVLQTEDVR